MGAGPGASCEEALSCRVEPQSHMGKSTQGGFPQERAAHSQVNCTASVASRIESPVISFPPRVTFGKKVDGPVELGALWTSAGCSLGQSLQGILLTGLL